MFENSDFILPTIKKVSIRKAVNISTVIFSFVPSETLNVLAYA